MSANANSREANISATAQERGAASDRTPIHERIRGTEAHISATAQERGAASASRQRETPSRGYMAGTSAAGRHCRRAAVEPPYCQPADVGRRKFRIRRSSQGHPRFRESSIQGVYSRGRGAAALIFRSQSRSPRFKESSAHYWRGRGAVALIFRPHIGR